MLEPAMKATITVRGLWLDVAHYRDGRSIVLGGGHNIVVDTGLALAVGALGRLNPGVRFWQVGTGDPNWDMNPPDAQADAAQLLNPIFQKEVLVSWWDRTASAFSPTPTDTVDVRVTFLGEEANGDLREFGLVGDDPDNVLFNYVIHGKLPKTENFNLERILRITMTRGGE